jgi:hypothetical protein
MKYLVHFDFIFKWCCFIQIQVVIMIGNEWGVNPVNCVQ